MKRWLRRSRAEPIRNPKMMMRKCIYCGASSGFIGRVCADCKKLLARVQELRGKVSYGQFLDGLEQSGVPRDKILRFLAADPEAAPDRIAARPQTASCAFVHDCNSGRAVAIDTTEIAAGQQANPHGAEVIGADGFVVAVRIGVEAA